MEESHAPGPLVVSDLGRLRGGQPLQHRQDARPGGLQAGLHDVGQVRGQLGGNRRHGGVASKRQEQIHALPGHEGCVHQLVAPHGAKRVVQILAAPQGRVNQILTQAFKALEAHVPVHALLLPEQVEQAQHSVELLGGLCGQAVHIKRRLKERFHRLRLRGQHLEGVGSELIASFEQRPVQMCCTPLTRIRTVIHLFHVSCEIRLVHRVTCAIKARRQLLG
mmetsp:Transcript_16534/g.29457  ORF Transcript_16534/g.29457 Transcript_16534/m.29457 type:complete len:221 (+) Transcript_16534:1162-1824(+)